MDDDGLTFGQTIPIKVKVIVQGEEMTIDLSEVSRQVGGYYNAIKPDFGPNWQIRAQVQFMFPK